MYCSNCARTIPWCAYSILGHPLEPPELNTVLDVYLYSFLPSFNSPGTLFIPVRDSFNVLCLMLFCRGMCRQCEMSLIKSARLEYDPVGSWRWTILSLIFADPSVRKCSQFTLLYDYLSVAGGVDREDCILESGHTWIVVIHDPPCSHPRPANHKHSTNWVRQRNIQADAFECFFCRIQFVGCLWLAGHG